MNIPSNINIFQMHKPFDVIYTQHEYGHFKLQCMTALNFKWQHSKWSLERELVSYSDISKENSHLKLFRRNLYKEIKDKFIISYYLIVLFKNRWKFRISKLSCDFMTMKFYLSFHLGIKTQNLAQRRTDRKRISNMTVCLARIAKL